MSSSTTPPAAATSPGSERPSFSERRQSLKGFVSRAKSVLRGDRTKRQSISELPSDPNAPGAATLGTGSRFVVPKLFLEMTLVISLEWQGSPTIN